MSATHPSHGRAMGEPRLGKREASVQACGHPRSPIVLTLSLPEYLADCDVALWLRLQCTTCFDRQQQAARRSDD